MPRAKTGQLIWRKSGWYARVWVMIDGEEVRQSVALGTEVKSVAKRKLTRLLAKLAAEQNGTQVAVAASKGETYATTHGQTAWSWTRSSSTSARARATPPRSTAH